MMKLKKLLSVAALAAAMMINASAIDLYVDSVKLEPDVTPTVVEGHTLVPLRSVFDALDTDLQWDNTTKTAAGSRSNSTISIQVGSPTALVNGEEKILGAPAQVINGSTMIPARFVAEGLNCIVKWDKAADGIYISTTGGDPVIPKPAPTSSATPSPASTSSPVSTSAPASTSALTVTVNSGTGSSSNGGVVEVLSIMITEPTKKVYANCGVREYCLVSPSDKFIEYTIIITVNSCFMKFIPFIRIGCLIKWMSRNAPLLQRISDAACMMIWIFP